MGPCLCCHGYFPVRMGFHQGAKAQSAADAHIPFELFHVQKGTDQQDRGGAQHLCLINLVFVHGKILAQQRKVYLTMDFLQVPVSS